MNPDPSDVGRRIDEIVAEFSELEPRERLELLLEFAENLPPLPEAYRAEQQRAAHRIHECQSPVFMWVEVVDGRVSIAAEVPAEAPTIRGFVSILVSAFQGAPANQVLAVNSDLVSRLGLSEALGMMRMRGLHAILLYVRRQLQKQVDPAACE